MGRHLSKSASELSHRGDVRLETARAAERERSTPSAAHHLSVIQKTHSFFTSLKGKYTTNTYIGLQHFNPYVRGKDVKGQVKVGGAALVVRATQEDMRCSIRASTRTGVLQYTCEHKDRKLQ
ncbi:unnamed protein product [Bemisia tabaci]|uniref:Uncharacterized protein n=1 Tax=Bemisia tabaci TaxID=7038 RepID=A0A9P0ALA6_BEMTA|nr:unnamed protein product [Bemisia tabaci]